VQVRLKVVVPVVSVPEVGRYVGKASELADTMQEFATVAVTENEVVAVPAVETATGADTKTADRTAETARRCTSFVDILASPAVKSGRFRKSDYHACVRTPAIFWRRHYLQLNRANSQD
jgi:hypothetical protein